MTRTIPPTRLLLATMMAVILGFSVDAPAQLKFTSICAMSLTSEQGIQLSWLSGSNETYAIYEADTLETNASGTIT